MTDLARIIAELEKATGPSRELDDQILELFRSPTLSEEEIAQRLEKGEAIFSGNLFVPHNSAFTSSIDAALTLVPANWSWRTGNLPSGKGYAQLGTLINETEGATPAIALYIAALRARQAREKVDG